jgi:calmodulin
MDRLSDEKRAEIEEAFRLFDKNGNGTITAEDLRSVLRALGYDPSPDETSDMLKEMGVSSSSTNDGGSVDLNSFVAFMATKVPLAGFEEEIRNAFRLFDKDGDGFITPAELKTVLGRLGENLTDEDVTAMIAEADTDGDGQVSFEEFKKIMLTGHEGQKQQRAHGRCHCRHSHHQHHQEKPEEVRQDGGQQHQEKGD